MEHKYTRVPLSGMTIMFMQVMWYVFQKKMTKRIASGIPGEYAYNHVGNPDSCK